MTRPSETTLHQALALGCDPALRRRFMVMDEPPPGKIRFGLLLEILDKVAEETALRYVSRFHPATRVVTTAIDTIAMRHTVDVTRNQTFSACINVDGDLQHRPVPTVYPATYAEDARYLAAHRSRQIFLRHRNRI